MSVAETLTLVLVVFAITAWAFAKSGLWPFN